MTILFRHILAFFLLNALVIASLPAASATSSDTALARLATKLAPGESRELNARVPDEFETYNNFLRHTFTSDCPDQWGEQGHWHRGRGQSFFLGDRTQSTQQRDPDDDDIVFVSYLAGENRWVHNSKTGVRDSNDHHPYSQMALDEKRDRYYRIKNDAVWVYDIEADTHEGYEGPQAWSRVNQSFPANTNSPKEVHEALDHIVMADDKGNVYGVNPDDFSDQTLLGTRSGQSGYQSLMTYNRVRNELLWIGGTNSNSMRMVTLVDAQGNVVAKRNAPDEVSTGIASVRVFYDPSSGNYLLLDNIGSQTPGILWEYSPVKDEWRVAADFSKPEHDWWPGPYCGHVMIPLDGYGVTMWMTRYGTRVYRHKSVFVQGKEPVSKDNPTYEPAPTPESVPSGDHPFYAIAADMQPGEFKAVETTLPPGVEDMSRMNHTNWHPDDDSNGTFGVGWTDRTLFDPRTGRLFNVLMRGNYTESITWLEPDLRWTGIMTPADSGIGGRRPYNRLMDGGDGYMYFAPQAPNDRIGRLTRARYSDPSDWEEVAMPLPMDRSGHAVGDFSTIWHPDIKKFVLYIYGRGQGKLTDAGIADYEQGHVWVWGHGDAGWQHPRNHPDYRGSPGRTQSSGYGGTTLYNPVHREVLIYGGSANWSDPHPLGPQSTATIDRNGQFKRHGPSGQVYTTGSRRLTYHPITGDYILTVRGDDKTDLKMYIGDPPRGKAWKLLYDWEGVSGADRPLHPYENWHRVTPLPGTDVLIWSDLRRGVVLQRLPKAD
ncbi:hypothetical protein EDC23_0172 [Thiohalophilus thiocyanatoxydans]|uniref:BNR repeat neuraminidase n=1 Tax=Thiohalophilus thiocyanatoxydans TaxID=381308 RepID=A0A4R8IRY9_9GAMM|nr:hypothetical protein EDC23_0172 [Thiohalophilus thiocyanatoxydans]